MPRRLAPLTAIFVTPGVAFAHNCANLSDCWQLPEPAAVASLAISTLLFFLPEMLKLLGLAGDENAAEPSSAEPAQPPGSTTTNEGSQQSALQKELTQLEQIVNRDGIKGNCSKALKEMLTYMGYDIDSLGMSSLDANGIYDLLEKISLDGTGAVNLVSAAEAQTLANKGHLVIAAQRNNNINDKGLPISGHVALVVPSNEEALDERAGPWVVQTGVVTGLIEGMYDAPSDDGKRLNAFWRPENHPGRYPTKFFDLGPSEMGQHTNV